MRPIAPFPAHSVTSGTVIGRVRRLAAVAVAAQVRHDDGELLRELRRNQPVRDVALRRPVQEQQRRTLAALDDVDLGARRLDLRDLEAREVLPGEGGGVGLLGIRSLDSASRGDGGDRGGVLQELAAVPFDLACAPGPKGPGLRVT
jgi:hypothetical protein